MTVTCASDGADVIDVLELVDEAVADVELLDGELGSALLAVAVAMASPQVIAPAATAARNLVRVVCCIVFPHLFDE